MSVVVRALVFDVFGTLVDWRAGIVEAFRRAGLQEDPERLADAWRAAVWPVLDEVNKGKRGWLTFDDVHRVVLDELVAEHGLALPDETRAELVWAWHRLDPWPDVQDGLERLRSQRIVAALSNGNVALLVDLARHGDLRFDCLFSAEMPHVYKPAAEVYLTAARMLGLAPDEVMLVAAHPWDLTGARSAGLRTAFVDRPLEYGSGSPPREDPDADESVADLVELADSLSG